MKKGYSLIGVLIVVVILGILATGAIPSFRQIIRRAELKEVGNMVDAVIAGAKYYELKYGTITTLPLYDSGTQKDWPALNVELPGYIVCTYKIVAAGSTGRRLQVDSSSSGAWLYTYDLPRGPGAINAGNSDEKYVQDLP